MEKLTELWNMELIMGKLKRLWSMDLMMEEHDMALKWLWRLALIMVFCILIFGNKDNFMIFSALSILLSALIASASLMKSIKVNQNIKAEEKKISEQENKILLAFILRTFEQNAQSYISKLSDLVEGASESIQLSKTQQTFLKNLSMLLGKQLDSMIDKEMLHVLFYRDFSGNGCVTKLIDFRKDVYNLISRIDDIHSGVFIEVIYIQAIINDLESLSKTAIKIKNNNCRDRI